MPYTKSRARKVFDTEVNQMISVIRDAYSSKANSSDVKVYVLSSAVMLCTARLEVYLEDLVNDWVHRINSSNQICKSLPDNLRAHCLNNGSVMSAYRQFIALNDEMAFLKSIGNALSAKSYVLGVDGESVPKLNSNQIHGGKKYPSPDNVKHLFNRLGIDRVFEKFNTKAKADVKASLQSFNDIRTAVAHQGIPVGANDKDIKNRLLEMKRVVSYIDKVFYTHVCKYTGSATWTT
jgi:hypothetical protein